jgi:hypothetical protein
MAPPCDYQRSANAQGAVRHRCRTCFPACVAVRGCLIYIPQQLPHPQPAIPVSYLHTPNNSTWTLQIIASAHECSFLDLLHYRCTLFSAITTPREPFSRSAASSQDRSCEQSSLSQTSQLDNGEQSANQATTNADSRENVAHSCARCSHDSPWSSAYDNVHSIC